MEGCATPDNHSLMLHQHADPSGTGIGYQPANKSYDHVDHKPKFSPPTTRGSTAGASARPSPPPSSPSGSRLGKKCYDTWQNYLENARISDDLDFCSHLGLGVHRH